MLWNVKSGSIPMDGTRMSYVSFGSGERALVLLPGLSDGLATVKGKGLLLAPPYRLFFDKFTVYMFSRKDALERGATIRDMAGDQAAALKRLGLKKVFLVGVSQGGMIAQCLAEDYPDLVERLVIAVSSPGADEMIRENVESTFRQLAGFLLCAVLTAVRMSVLAQARPYVGNALMNATPLFLAFVLLIFAAFNVFFVGGFFRSGYRISRVPQ